MWRQEKGANCENQDFWAFKSHISLLHDFQTAFSDFLSNGGLTTEDLSLKAQAILTSLVTNPVLDFLHIEVMHDNLLESTLILES